MSELTVSLVLTFRTYQVIRNPMNDLVPLPMIVDTTFMSRWVYDLTNEQYHAEKQAISSTGLRKMLKSPMSFFSYHALSEKEEPTEAMNFGTAFHLALLEPDLFKSKFVIEREFNGKGSVAAYNEWEATHSPGALIIKQEKYDDLMGMIESVNAHVEARELLKGSKMEQSGFYRDSETGILCKFRADFFHFGLMALGDVKTAVDCTRDGFSRAIWANRLDIQIYMYTKGIQEIMGKEVQYPMFLVVEKKPPYEVALYTVDSDLLLSGRHAYETAMNQLKVCLENQSWPRYQQQNQTIGLPRWATYE